jgi:HK97 gp10 family phage protein
MGVKVTVQDNSAEILAAIEAAVRKGIREVADQVTEGARQRAPRLTGALSESYHVEEDEEGDTVSAYVTNTKRTFYGHFVELGTKHAPAKPHLFPALEEQRGKLDDAIRRAAGGL